MSAVASGGTGGTYTLQSYNYDSTTGNLSSKAGVNYTYGDINHKHAVTQMGSDSFTYDANGNQITRSVAGSNYTLTYDAENRLVSVSGAALASFVYDGDGNRVKGTIGGVNTTYIGNYFEWKTSTSDMVEYYYAGSTRVAMRTGSSTLNFLLGDHLGSTAITTDSLGANPAEIRYMPWGTTRYTSGTTPTTYRFTGQRLESSFGLYYYGARWYDPYLNRWIQPDPIISNKYNSTDLDRYSYVRNNPTNYIDPTGNKPCDGNNTSLDQCNGITNDDLIQVLKIVYRWKVIGNWTKKELNNLIDSANYVEKGVDLLTNGNGKGWMYSTMSNISFVHTSGTDFVLEQIGNIFNNGLPIAGMVPFDSSSVYLYQGEINFATVTHELGHVWDINSGNGICPATWCGGGLADDLTVNEGGNSSGVRWTNGTSGVPIDNQWSMYGPGYYGNTSTADYFAESFEWLLYYLVNPTHMNNLPNNVLDWMISTIR